MDLSSGNDMIKIVFVMTDQVWHKHRETRSETYLKDLRDTE